MKRIITVLALGTIVALSGCDKSTTGGPGVNLPESEQSTIGLTEDTFSLNTPMLSTKLAQGGTANVTIGIKRGKNIDQDVTLSFNELPAGVTIDPMNPVIKHGDSDAKITVTATADAALGDFLVKVKGHPATGPDATSELKITVGEA